MQLFITTEHHFIKATNGNIYSSTGGRDYNFWCRYLDIFSKVTVIARVRQEALISHDILVANGENVDFLELPDYTGGKQFLWQFKEIRNSIHSINLNNSAVILRVPGIIGELVQREAAKKHHPYGVEVVGDPFAVFSPKGIKHPLRPFIRWKMTQQLKKQCANAHGASYVTKNILQQQYPVPSNMFSTHYSSVEMPNEAYVSKPKKFSKTTHEIILVSVGTFSQLYKAPDILIDAVNQCLQEGLKIRLVFVGSGKYKPELEARTTMLGIEKHVDFLGQLPSGDAVRTQLDQSDVFVLASRTEGLPRAIIEAMARGLPCISSTVGGIPELLPSDDLVPPDDISALAKKIRDVITNPSRMARMSARNLQKSQEYHNEILHKQRIKFYKYMRTVTANQLGNQE